MARAHGLTGELAIRTHDPASQVLAQVKRLFLDRRTGTALGPVPGEEVKLLAARPAAASEWLVRVERITDRRSAETLKGRSVHVFREDVAPADEGSGEFFQGDLVGLEAVSPEGTSLGRVEAIWSTGPVPNLVIRGGEGEELLIPFADDFVAEIQLDRGRIVLRPPAYLE